MIAASFDESNLTLDPPQGVDLDACAALSVYRGIDDNGFPIVVSCWKMTRDERFEINRTGRVWLVCMGTTMPPVQLHGVKPLGERSPTLTEREREIGAALSEHLSAMDPAEQQAAAVKGEAFIRRKETELDADPDMFPMTVIGGLPFFHGAEERDIGVRNVIAARLRYRHWLTHSKAGEAELRRMLALAESNHG